MMLSFNSLNYSTCTLARMSSHHSHNRARKIPALATPPSSIISQTEESRNLDNSMENSPLDTASKRPDSSGLLSHQHAIGIIGGLSIGTTLNFVSKLVTWSSKDGRNALPFVLCSDPVLNKELAFHERGSSSYLSGKNENLLKDHASIVENLRHKRIFLEKSGARCIVMPCYISHSWHDEVALGSSVPVLHMGECVAKELKEANLRPLEAGSTVRIGVLASDATLSAGFYQEKLQNELEIVRGFQENVTNGSSKSSSLWLKRAVKNPRAIGCRNRPWICNEGEFPPRIQKFCCRNHCIDVTSDVNNCGFCGIRCPFTWQCCQGICIDTNMSPFHCGSCVHRCQPPSLCYNGMCGYAQPLPPWPFPPKPPPPHFPWPPHPHPPSTPRPPCSPPPWL